MYDWQDFPANYRETEASAILKAVRAGESINLVGLSGAGKSNLLGFLAHRWPLPGQNDDIRFFLLDCNALPACDSQTLLSQLYSLLGGDSGSPADSEFQLLNRRIAELFGSDDRKICLLLDRYEVIEQTDPLASSNNLRALRDAHKYQLTYIFASRRPLDPESELAELFYANSVWLGTMSRSDAEWNIARHAHRRGEEWPPDVVDTLIELSAGYPSFLRGLCEAYAQLNTLEESALTAHPSVQRRMKEFWVDQPKEEYLSLAGLSGLPMLRAAASPKFATQELTAKENALLVYLQDHPHEVCTKDDLIQAVWPEDEVYEAGIRDDSLAQLVRRLRVKIELDPSSPRFIHTVPGRGYRFTPE